MLKTELAPTPRDTIFADGTARLYRFRRPPGEATEAPSTSSARSLPLLIIPSLINRWYIVDLREGASLSAALNRSVDTYCLDWGVPHDEDRYLGWDAIVRRIGRMVRAVKRDSGAEKVGILGYCIGGTLSSIYAALHPSEVGALINLAGPIDFSRSGLLGELVDPRWFDPSAMAAAGNVSKYQMQSGFTAIRPISQLSKWVTVAANLHDDAFMTAFGALETWASDNIPFPGAAYETYISSLYQRNELVQRQHFVEGQRVVLSNIECPVLSVIASQDHICPGPAATALNDHVRAKENRVLELKGGHVGAVVGSRATKELYPALARWLAEHLASRAASAA